MRKSKKIARYNKIRKESISDNTGYAHRSHRTRKASKNDISEDYKRKKTKMIEDDLACA